MIKLAKQKKDDYSDNPFQNLGQRVFDRAVVDLVTLRLSGAVKGWEVMNPWPLYLGKPLVVLDDYSKTYQAQELVDYFLEGWSKRLLDAYSLEMDAGKVKAALEKEGLFNQGEIE